MVDLGPQDFVAPSKVASVFVQRIQRVELVLP